MAFAHAPTDEPTYVLPPGGLRKRGVVWIWRRAQHGARRASKLFGKLLSDALTQADLKPPALVPNAYYQEQRAMCCIVHIDGFMADSEGHQLD